MPLDERLDLDIADAQRRIDTVEAALSSAARTFGVELQRALGRISDVADVKVHADTTGVPGEVTAAIDAADTTAHVSVDADVQGAGDVQGLADNLDNVAAQGDKAGGVLSGLGGKLRELAAPIAALVGARELVGFFVDTVNAASDLNESASKSSVVFGENAAAIEDWARTADTAAGLSQQAALEAVGTFGNLLQALGTSREEASRLSPEIVQLAADLASFNNLDVGDALEKLRSGLVGEIEPLRSLGVSFNAAQVDAKAMELGLADATGQISEGAKVQARYALVVEQTTAAHGDFARTSSGLANQQRILNAEWDNMKTRIGQALLPVVLQLVQQTRGDLLPTIERLATAALPPLIALLGGLSPAFGGVLQIVSALTPILDAFAGIIDAIPAPVFTLIGLFASFRGILGLLPDGLGAAVGGIRSLGDVTSKLAQGAGGVGASLSGLISPLGLVSAALGAAVFVVNQHAEAKRKQRAAIEGVRDALLDEKAAYDEDFRSLTQQRVEQKHQLDDLDRLGLSYGDLTKIALGGREAIAGFIDKLVAAGELQIDAPVFRTELIDSIATFGDYEAALGDATRGNEGLVRSVAALRVQFRQGTIEAIQKAVADERIGRAAGDAAIAEIEHKGAAADLLGILTRLNIPLGDLNVNMATTARTTDSVVQGFHDIRDALAGAAPLTADQSAAYRVMFDEFRRGAPNIDLVSAAATQLGLTADDVTKFRDAVSSAVDAVNDRLIGQIPSAVDALGAAVDRNKDKITLKSVIADMDKQAGDIKNFYDRVTKLAEAGFTNTAALLAEKGPVAAGELARLLTEADTKQRRAFETSVNNYDSQRQRAETIVSGMTTTLPRFTAETARAVTAAFDKSLDLAGVSADEAARAKAALLAALGGEDTGNQAAADGEWLMQRFAQGIILGVDHIMPSLRNKVRQIGDEIIVVVSNSMQIKSPSRRAVWIGEQFVAGLALGLSEVESAVDAARALAGRVEAAAALTPSVPAFSQPTAAAATPAPAAAPIGTRVGTLAAGVNIEQLTVAPPAGTSAMGTADETVRALQAAVHIGRRIG